MAIFKTPAKDYDLLTTEFVCNKFGLAEFLAENFAAYNLKCANVLDVGCGAGSLSIYLAEQFSAKVLAVDLNPQAAACCRANVKRYNLAKSISVAERNFADLYTELEENSFQLILSNPPINFEPTVNLAFAKETFAEMNHAKYQFLTNGWHDERGFDLTDYILMAGQRLLAEDGNIILVCCDADGNSEKYIKNQAGRYNYDLKLLCEQKIPVAKLGITSADRDFVCGYIWLMNFLRKG